MKQPVLFILCLTMCIPCVQAQWTKKVSEKFKSITQKKETQSGGNSSVEEEDVFQSISMKNTSKPVPALTIGGDERVTMDSNYVFDVAVYQETEAYQGNQRVIDGGEDIVIYYSSDKPQFSIQLNSKSTGARYHFYADFEKDAQLSITAIHNIGSGEKQQLDLETMEPVYPGEVGYLTQLTRTGGKKVIAGIACEEYVAHNSRKDAKVTASSKSMVAAYVWIPMQLHTLFQGYGLVPEKYKKQIEYMLTQGFYPAVVFPLEMYLQYGNGDKVYTYTTDIVMGEKRKVNIADIIK
jgi:hypothetical protein